VLADQIADVVDGPCAVGGRVDVQQEQSLAPRQVDYPGVLPALIQRQLSDEEMEHNAEPGETINERVREIIRTWPSLTETTVRGRHFIQEDSPDEIGQAIARFARGLRSA
jgi:hypothetical protein